MRRREVFLSHASADRAIVERLASGLTRRGVGHFYSRRHIRGAQQWHDELGTALGRCNWFAIVLTPSAVRSVWVKRELLFALQARQYENRIVPLLYADCAMGKLSWTLTSFQHIDLRKAKVAGERAFYALLGARR